MSRFLHHSKGRASEANPQKKLSPVEQPSLQELIPEEVQPHLAYVSDEEKEFLHCLVLYGRNALLPVGASTSAGRTCKSSSAKAGVRQQVCRPCPASDVLDASACFSCYSRVWSRWNASPNRDVISDILESIENPEKQIQNPPVNPSESIPDSTSQIAPQVSKGKKKKRLDKKRGISETKVEKDENPQSGMAFSSRPLNLIDEDPHPLGPMDLVGDTPADGGPGVGIIMENGLIISSMKVIAGHMKGLLRGLKQKEKPFATSPNTAFTDENGGSLSISTTEGLGSAIAIEIPDNLTLGLSPCGSLGSSSSVSQGKINTKLQQPNWRGKRRSSQILPVDCEDNPVEDMKSESAIVWEDTQVSMSPRAADVGLGGRGFLARVFPDALGRVASRLWDLVSVRLRSRAVEYH